MCIKIIKNNNNKKREQSKTFIMYTLKHHISVSDNNDKINKIKI